MSAEVKLGQVWADGYYISDDERQVKVVEVGETHAVVELVKHRGFAKLGRRTRVRLDRFRPTRRGYRLVQDVPEGTS